MTKLESFFGCAALLGSLAAAVYAGEARAADLPLTFMSTPPACTFYVPTVFGTLECAGVQYGGGTAAGPFKASAPPAAPPSPPSPPSPPGGDGCEKGKPS